MGNTISSGFPSIRRLGMGFPKEGLGGDKHGGEGGLPGMGHFGFMVWNLKPRC
jgi:hypothetical protein